MACAGHQVRVVAGVVTAAKKRMEREAEYVGEALVVLSAASGMEIRLIITNCE